MNIYFIVILFCLMILFYIKYRNDKKSKFDNAIMILYRQTARWAAASIQDDSELIRLLHANYSAGYLWSLKDIVSTEEFKRITGEDFLTLESKIVSIQDTATKMIVDKCKPLIFVEEPLLFKAMYSRKNE